MAFTPHQSLAVANIIYFAPILVPTVFLCFRHGRGKVYGWACLVLFSALRLAGAALRIAADSQAPRGPSQKPSGLSTAAHSLENVALMPLLLVLLELLTRIKDRLQPHDPKASSLLSHCLHSTNPLIQRAWYYIPLAQTVEFILGILAFSLPSTSLRKAVFIINAVIFALAAYISAVYFCERERYDARDRRTPVLVIASVPFLAIRTVYAVGNAYSNGHWLGVVGNVVLGFLMEVAVVTLYIFAGLKMEPARKESAEEQLADAGNERL